MPHKVQVALVVLLIGFGIGGFVVYTQYKAARAAHLSCLKEKEQSVSISDFTRVSEELSKINVERDEALKKVIELEGQMAALKAGNAKHLEEFKQFYEQDAKKQKDEASALVGELKGRIAQLEEAAKKAAEFQARVVQVEEQKEKSLSELKSTYENIVGKLNREIQSKEISIKQFEERLKIDFINKILFGDGSTSITSKGARILSQIGESLKNIPEKKIYVFGYTDNLPIGASLADRYPSNWELSAARSCAVVRFLTEKVGLNPERFAAVGRAYHQPLASNDSEEGRARNRRAEIVIGSSLEF